MEQKDTYLIYLKKKVRTKTLEASIMILIEAGLFVLTWYKLGWQIVIQTFPIWFLFALVHYYSLSETFACWKRYKELSARWSAN